MGVVVVEITSKKKIASEVPLGVLASSLWNKQSKVMD